MSQATFKEMTDDVLDFINDHSPQAESLARSWINKHYDKFAKIRNWEDLVNRIDESLTFVADQAYLAFPEDCAQPISIVDKDFDHRLVRRELGQLDEDMASLQEASGLPVVYYASLGYKATKKPLSAAGVVAVKTELASDSSLDVIVQGTRSSPEVRDRETIVTHSSDPVTNSVSGSLTWRAGWSISSISARAGLNGFITVHVAGDATNVLSNLSEHSRSSRYMVIQLQNPPSAANRLTLVYKRRILPLVDDDDTPVIPISEAIVEATLASMRRNDEQYTQAREHEQSANAFLNSVVAEQGGEDRTSHRSRPAAARFRHRYRGP